VLLCIIGEFGVLEDRERRKPYMDINSAIINPSLSAPVLTCAERGLMCPSCGNHLLPSMCLTHINPRYWSEIVPTWKMLISFLGVLL